MEHIIYSFKLSEPLSDFKRHILKWDGPPGQYQSYVLCTINRL